MIAKLIKDIMVECGLQQFQLAEVLGCSLSRVKAISSGRVQNLTRKEYEALVTQLHINPAWLLTGRGSIFTSDLATRLQLERMRLGLTPAEMAEKAALPPSTYNAVEAGSPPDPATRTALLAIPAINVNFLLSGMRSSSSNYALPENEAYLLELYRAYPKVRTAIDAIVELTQSTTQRGPLA